MCEDEKKDHHKDHHDKDKKKKFRASCCGHDIKLDFTNDFLKDLNLHDLKKNLPAMGREIREFVRSTITSGRGNPIMVRIEDDVLASIDKMVASELFKSRSEASAFLISKGLEATNDLFGQVMEKTNEIEKLRTQIKDILGVKETEEEPEPEPEPEQDEDVEEKPCCDEESDSSTES